MLEINKQKLDQLFQDNPQSNQVILVDFSNMMLIFFHAYQQLNVTSVSGHTTPTGAVFGFTNLVSSIFKIAPNALIVFAMDAGTGFRKEIYPSYKANRVLSDEKKSILSYVDKITSMLSIVPNVYFAKTQGMEADDVIATLSFSFKELNKDVVIYSRDGDFKQLMSHGINVAQKIGHSDFEYATEDDIMDKYGVTSNYLLHYRTLCGDDSDNIEIPVKNLRTSFKLKFVRLWKDQSYDHALKAMHKDHKKDVERMNSLESRAKIKVNYQIMDLQKYKSLQHQFEINVFKGNLDISVPLIEEFQMRQFQHFLRLHFPDSL